jgi:general secretion pathway protein D
MEEVRIVADAENNSLLIWATNQNYERIINALQKMDVAPRQVLIEAIIAEVTLTGNLQYGLQWFFENEAGSNHGKDYTGTGSLGIGSEILKKVSPVLPTTTDGFSYAITNSGGLVRGLLQTLANDAKLKVLSSPQVMVLDNQKALIRVGEQQPIPAAATTTNNITTSGGIDYKDTGVMLEVLPRVNSGGMVNMDIRQEVVDLGDIDVATKQHAFIQRSINSKVSIHSGETLVLGGLIRDVRRDSEGGLPVLYKVPVVGSLFGSTIREMRRTELVVLITPRVVENSQEASQLTDEIRRKMRELAPLIPAS